MPRRRKKPLPSVRVHPAPDPIRELHRLVHLDAFDAVLAWVKLVSRRTRRGDAVFTFLDDDRRLVELFVVEDGAAMLPTLVEFMCSADEPEVSGLLLVTDRTGEIPADRPDDELRWQELVDLAAAGATTLFDWFVVGGGRWGFSLAEHAPTPAAW